MNEDNTPIKVVFAPGCFDTFEGSQEELDELMAEIQRMVESGEMMDRSRVVDLEELYDADPEAAEQVLRYVDTEPSNRKLQ